MYIGGSAVVHDWRKRNGSKKNGTYLRAFWLRWILREDAESFPYLGNPLSLSLNLSPVQFWRWWIFSFSRSEPGRVWPIIKLAKHGAKGGFDPNAREDILGSRSLAIQSYSESGIGVEDPALWTRGRWRFRERSPQVCAGQSSQMIIFFSLGSYLSHKLAPRRPRLLWNTMQTSVRLLVWYRTWDAWSRTWISVQPQFWSCLASDRELCICCYANLWCGASFWILLWCGASFWILIKPDCVSLWCIKVCFQFLI